MRHQVLGDALAEVLGVTVGQVLQGKGGFWVQGHGFFTLAQARKLTGITATPRVKRERIPAWGDYAIIAMLNRPIS